jgi:hypothetical protein
MAIRALTLTNHRRLKMSDLAKELGAEPSYTTVNRETLSRVVVDNMDFRDLVQMAYERQMETYVNDKQIFEQDWEYMQMCNIPVPMDLN